MLHKGHAGDKQMLRSIQVDYQKIDMVVLRVLMMCGWLSLLTLTGKWPS